MGLTLRAALSGRAKLRAAVRDPGLHSSSYERLRSTLGLAPLAFQANSADSKRSAERRRFTVTKRCCAEEIHRLQTGFNGGDSPMPTVCDGRVAKRRPERPPESS